VAIQICNNSNSNTLLVLARYHQYVTGFMINVNSQLHDIKT